MNEAVEDAESSAQGMLAAPSLLQSVFSDNEGLTDTWGPVVKSVGQFAALVGNISKVCLTAIRSNSRSADMSIHRYTRMHDWPGKCSRLYPRYVQYLFTISAALDMSISQIINEQLKTDEELRNLVAAMKYTHDFVCSAKTLQEIEMHAEHFVKMSCATLECGYLIQEYVRTGSFGRSISIGIQEVEDSLCN